ncbi:MAG TPA: hypothetical protein VIV15_01400 [Anaerolineales bacterium]
MSSGVGRGASMRAWAKAPAVMIASVALVGLIAGCSRLQGEVKIAPDTIRAASNAIIAVLDDAVKSAGGDLENQHLHLVVAFSTGHFPTDPARAAAARAIASDIVYRYLVRDDKVSAYAWEMELWEYSRSRENPIQIPEDAGREKVKLQDLWPVTARAESRPGHDTERAIVQIAGQLETETDAIILLLTNNAASVAPPGGSVIGENDPEYLSVLERWTRLPAVTRTGASMELTFAVIGPTGRADRTLDAVIVVPKQFAAQPLDPAPRSVRVSEEPGGPPVSPWLVVLLIAAAVAAGGYTAWRGIVNRPRREWLLTVNSTRFPVNAVAEGEEICAVAGVGYEGAGDRTVSVAEDTATPPKRLARLFRARGGVRVEGDFLRLARVDDLAVDDAWVIRYGSRHRMLLRGEYAKDLALPPRQVEVTLNISLTRLE